METNTNNANAEEKAKEQGIKVLLTIDESELNALKEITGVKMNATAVMVAMRKGAWFLRELRTSVIGAISELAAREATNIGLKIAKGERHECD